MFEGATFPSNKPCVCKANNRESFSHKSHKNRGHLGTFFSNSSRLGVFERKISRILDSVKKTGLWVTIFGKNRGLGLMLGVKIKGQMCGSWCVPLLICEWFPHWFGVLSSWAWTLTNWPRLNLAHACLDIHGLMYMDLDTVYSAPPSTLLPLLTKSKILQPEFQYACVLEELYHCQPWVNPMHCGLCCAEKICRLGVVYFWWMLYMYYAESPAYLTGESSAIHDCSVADMPQICTHGLRHRYTQDHNYSTNKVSKKTVIVPHFFVCLFLVLDAGENFWNLDKKIDGRIFWFIKIKIDTVFSPFT